LYYEITGFFGQISGMGGKLLKRFGEVGKQALSKFVSIKHAYANVNNASGGIIRKTLESILSKGTVPNNVMGIVFCETTASLLVGANRQLQVKNI